MIKDKAAIAGISQSAFSKSLEQSELRLACQVVSDALLDAGISPEEVDGLASYTMETTSDFELAKNLGFGELSFFAQTPHGGGGGPATIGLLAMAVATGQCKVGVAWRSRKRGAPDSRVWANRAASAGLVTAANWSRPWGVLRPVDEIALLTARYFHETGASRNHLAKVALNAREMANNNPLAMMYDKVLTREKYFDARWISQPLCLFDNCLESDGAAAVVITSTERARDCRHRPVKIHAYGQGLSRQSHSMIDFFSENPMYGSSDSCARMLYQHSDIKPADVDVAQIYDAFTSLVLFSLEAYGFCSKGEAASYIDQNGLGLNSPMPVNTAGGGLSEAYIHGFNLITEGVKQLRGTACNQVDSASTCLVTGGGCSPTSAIILRS
ncbi:thiolase C-terminal domain-containing protein [Parahaliea mediterranea]|uniref:Lipid-transfer protein n=1 Tax=Parahaliea mediterranea TaxID=651086 RepID=A0A939DER2_9GAMM|nr:lipid-transfer protein [Parahaliea mediterranea]MBN7796925.1 lipid-transfer protein [Parahaliea mediterranea]